ncbi:MAG TPA: type II secretion system protein [Mariprofundaceae bacterium]|nr:type II secretion system protein [Mariprofundaceae bacterium]
MREQGFSLIEALVAMAVLTILMGSLIPAFYYYNHANTRTEIKTEAVTVAQHLLDEYRQQSPSKMPTSGTTTSNMTTNNRTFAVRTTYCKNSNYCGPNTRQITIEVNYDGKTVYRTETVYTQLH